jgi:hypothetical protein
MNKTNDGIFDKHYDYAAWYMSYARGTYVNFWNQAATLFMFILLSFIFNK